MLTGELCDNQTYVDVTLAGGDVQIHAHKLTADRIHLFCMVLSMFLFPFYIEFDMLDIFFLRGFRFSVQIISGFQADLCWRCLNSWEKLFRSTCLCSVNIWMIVAVFRVDSNVTHASNKNNNNSNFADGGPHY